MSDVAIRVKGLGKRYRVDQVNVKNNRRRYLADALLNVACKPLRRVSSFVRQPSANGDRLRVMGNKHIWALKDLDFEVNYGEIVGIIGRNGAGKSTLLKILTGVTEPTEGYAEIHGRVGSLLEVGTGFHPELTGRENTYLNGAILGMRRAEIDRNFDEIVAFADIEEFIDTPVKRYSSGMYMRLAFAVAAHLESEILLVDEVLAVGDAAFQKKCLGKISEVAHGGRTVLFISHNMAAVRTLCRRGIVLDRGRKAYEGVASKAIKFYSAESLGSTAAKWVRPQTATFAPLAFEAISLSMSGEQPCLKLHCDMKIRCWEPCARSFVAVDVSDQTFSPIMQALPEALPFIEGIPGIHQIHLEVDLPPLIPGLYNADFWLGPHYTTTWDCVGRALAFEVAASPSDNRSFPHSPDHGSVVPTCRYTYKARQLQMAVSESL